MENMRLMKLGERFGTMEPSEKSRSTVHQSAITSADLGQSRRPLKLERRRKKTLSFTSRTTIAEAERIGTKRKELLNL